MIKSVMGIVTGLILLVLLIAPLRVAAYSPFDSIDCSGEAANSTVCKSKGDTSNPLYGKDSVLVKVTNTIAIFAGIVAIFIIIIAGGRFVTSSGDAKNIATARNTILYAAIGLVVITLSRTIIVYVINHFG